MDLVVVSAETKSMSEYDLIYELFDEGMDLFHVRKPGFSREKVEHFLNPLRTPVRERMTVHGQPAVARKYKLGGLHLNNEPIEAWEGRRSCSVHSLDELKNLKDTYDYVFLSPVFDSISKENYPSQFSKKELTDFLKDRPDDATKVYALGGVSEKNISEVHEMGFDGAAILGVFWNTIFTHKAMDKFKHIRDYCKSHGS